MAKVLEVDRERARAFGASHGMGSTAEHQLAAALAAHRHDALDEAIKAVGKAKPYGGSPQGERMVEDILAAIEALKGQGR